MPEGSNAAANTLAVVQGGYYALTGIWPLVSLSTFLLITGDKTDTWLVQTVGVLVIAIALPLLVAAWRRSVTRELVILGIASAAGFAAVDVLFYAQGRIGSIYLADAVLELILVLAWTVVLVLESNRRHGAPSEDATASGPAGRTLF